MANPPVHLVVHRLTILRARLLTRHSRHRPCPSWILTFSRNNPRLYTPTPITPTTSLRLSRPRPIQLIHLSSSQNQSRLTCVPRPTLRTRPSNHPCLPNHPPIFRTHLAHHTRPWIPHFRIPNSLSGRPAALPHTPAPTHHFLILTARCSTSSITLLRRRQTASKLNRPRDADLRGSKGCEMRGSCGPMSIRRHPGAGLIMKGTISACVSSPSASV